MIWPWASAVALMAVPSSRVPVICRLEGLMGAVAVRKMTASVSTSRLPLKGAAAPVRTSISALEAPAGQSVKVAVAPTIRPTSAPSPVSGLTSFMTVPSPLVWYVLVPSLKLTVYQL